MSTEAYHLEQADDLERFARQADTIALRDAFLMAAETNRALARKAAACTQDDRALCA